ncbi:hypothetical protein Tco_0991438 [Tanacetum coccineum]|uniref:Uncharacterized protein n=1 Tax=Tanacetum coccineum TaxID=301880 RepID=A0ABQ5EZM1_9ASTR
MLLMPLDLLLPSLTSKGSVLKRVKLNGSLAHSERIFALAEVPVNGNEPATETLQLFKNWKAEEEEEANNQRLLQLRRDHEEQLASMPRYNLFEDDSYEDEAYYTDEDDFEALDYEDAHLAFDREKSLKFYF